MHNEMTLFIVTIDWLEHLTVGFFFTSWIDEHRNNKYLHELWLQRGNAQTFLKMQTFKAFHESMR